MINNRIEYKVIPEQKMVIAILKNTRYDACKKAAKICRQITSKQNMLCIGINYNKLQMPDNFNGTVICHTDDIFNEEIGKNLAKKICLEKYHASFDKRMNLFRKSLNSIRDSIFI